MTDQPKGDGSGGDLAARKRRARSATGSAGRPPAGGPAKERAASLDPAMLRLLAGIAAGLVLGVLLGALLFGGDDDGSAEAPEAIGPMEAQIVSPAELAAEARSLGRPVYWAGPSDQDQLEMARNEDGDVSVAYIPEGEDPEGPDADFLTVLTYRFPDARKALEAEAASGNRLSRELPDGGFLLSQPSQPTSVYVAYRGEDYQVEVYDPRPGRALQLALAGSIVAAR